MLTVTGRLSATDERAVADARAKLERVLSERLAPEVPRDWKVPPGMIDEMIREVVVVPRERDYGTVYEATLKADLSPARLARIVDVYHREEVVKRLLMLGAVLAFVLVCLAAVSGYIKADEATKGYYTNRLRLAAAAGVGAAGVVLYRWLDLKQPERTTGPPPAYGHRQTPRGRGPMTFVIVAALGLIGVAVLTLPRPARGHDGPRTTVGLSSARGRRRGARVDGLTLRSGLSCGRILRWRSMIVLDLRVGGGPLLLSVLVGLAVLVLLARAWVGEFLFLMGLRDDDFPGRRQADLGPQR